MNEEYRIARQDDLIIGAEVFCYYVSPYPDESSRGVVITLPDDEGWVDVRAEDGKKHYMNADRLGVLK